MFKIPCKKITFSALEIHLLTYHRAENIRVGLVINFNVERLKDGIKRVIF